MTTIHIPPAAMEAGAREMYLRANPDLKWEDCAIECGQDVRQAYLYRARAAFEAMVTAWEGMTINRIGILLPLPVDQIPLTEKQDDKA